VDHLWRRWAQGHLPDRYYDQRLYVCENAASETPDPDFRLAQPEEAEEIAKRAGQMEWEDLGRNPADENAEAHLRAVQERIFQGRLWVLVREGELVFQINVGSSHARGVQVGGTYVPPRFRGQGLAAHGMRQLCRELLQTHRFVTLHVNEANPSAVRTYENSSFKRYSPFRLIMATWPTETP